MIYQQSIQRDILKQLSNDYNAFAVQTVSVTTSALGLTIPSGAKYALIQIESTNTVDAVRFWINATPTSTVGMIRNHLDVLDLIGANNLAQFRFIKGAGGGTSQLNIIYYR